MTEDDPIVIYEDEVIFVPPGASLRGFQFRMGSRPEPGADAYREAHSIKLKEQA